MATALHRGVHAAGSSTSRSRLPQRSLIGRPVPAPSVSIRGITTSWPKWPVMPSPPQYGDYDVLDVSSAMSSYPDPLPVPDSIRRPSYVPANFFTAPIWEHEETTDNSAPSKIKLGTRAHERVRAAGQAAAEVLAEVGKLVRPGITTAQLDEAAHAAILRRGAYPSPLGYSHFPKSCTTSVNNVVARELTDLQYAADIRWHPGRVSLTLLPDSQRMTRYAPSNRSCWPRVVTAWWRRATVNQPVTCLLTLQSTPPLH